MYADDLIILSRTAPGLQKCLDCLSSYCQKWKLSINMTKTKCMSFQSENKKCKKVQLRVNNSVIENVSEYKCLLMTINGAGSLSPTLSNSSEKARRAIFALNNRFSLKRLPVRIALKLFDSYISPVLLYGLEIWMPFYQTDFNIWNSTKIEFVHLKFCRHILEVNRSTSNILVRGEMGRMPLKTAVDTKIVQYYKHLIHSENKLVHQTLQLDREMHENQCSDTFTGYINALSHDIGVLQGSKGIEGYSKAKVKYMIYDHYQKIWELRLNLNPKARFYHSF